MTNKPVERLSTNFFAVLNARIAEMRAAGADVIRLDIGSPDLPPAAPIIAALAKSAARPESHGYQSHLGPPALREAWAGMYRRLYGLQLDPQSEVLPLMGSKEGVFHLSQALLNPGDLVLVPDPGYQTYLQGAYLAGAQVYSLPLLAENDYLPDLEAVPAEIAERARLLWLNYPNNPTAAVASGEFFAQAVAFCRRHAILLCHDAAYAQVTFDGYRAPSVLAVPGATEVAIEFNTLSKSHNMAGWRVGAALGNRAALADLLKLKTHADSGQFLPVLQAATAAMTGDQAWLAERNAIYQLRRDRVLAALQGLGLPVRAPLAALYVWFALPEGRANAVDFVLDLLDRAQVSLAPGTLFGPRGEGYVRLSLTAPLARVEEAMARVGAVISQ